MNKDTVHDFIASLSDVERGESLGENLVAYTVKTGSEGEAKLFAIVDEGAAPLRVSLRCDPNLALVLREQYETVLPGENLSRKDWNTVICSGQLSDDEVYDLVRHAHLLVAGV